MSLSAKTVVVFTALIVSGSTGNITAPEDQMFNATEADGSNSNSKIFGLPLVVIPHVLCTGMNIAGILEACFPVGCICAKGNGICNIKNQCIRVSWQPEAVPAVYPGWRNNSE